VALCSPRAKKLYLSNIMIAEMISADLMDCIRILYDDANLATVLEAISYIRGLAKEHTIKPTYSV
jgi:hypothetical protein